MARCSRPTPCTRCAIRRTALPRAGRGLRQRRDGLCLPSDRAAGVSAHARRTDRHDHTIISGDGRRVQTWSFPAYQAAGTAITIGPGFYVGAHVGDSSIERQRQHRQHRDRRRIRSDLSPAHRIGTAAFSSATTTCCRPAWCSAWRPTCPPAASRRRRSPTPPAPARIRTTVFDSETVRGRLGYAFDNVLFYGTGGLAWSNDQFVRTQLTGTLNLATAGTDEAVNKCLAWLDRGRRHCLRLRAKLECVCRVSLHELWIVDHFAAVLAAHNELDDECERDRTWRELQVQFGRAVRPQRAKPLPQIGGIGVTSSLQVAARFPCLRLDRRLSRRRWRVRLGRICGNDGNFDHRRGSSARAVQLYGQTGRSPASSSAANYQFNRLVAGVEGDWQRSNLIGNNQQQNASALGAVCCVGVFPGGPFTSVHDDQRLSSRSAAGSASPGIASLSSAPAAGPGAILRSLTLFSDPAPFVTNGTNANGWTAWRRSRLRPHRSRLWPDRIPLYQSVATPASSTSRPTFRRCRRKNADQRCARRHRIQIWRRIVPLPIMIATVAGGHDG